MISILPRLVMRMPLACFIYLAGFSAWQAAAYNTCGYNTFQGWVGVLVC